jgi:hypothetical protein
MPITRRALLASAAPLYAATPIRREAFLKSPGKGAAIMAYAFYTRPTGGDMLSIEQRWSRSDTIDISYIRRSTSHGRTWSTPEERKTGERRPNGMLRRHPRAGWVDPRTGRYIEFWNEGILPTDDPLEGMRQWRLYYRISADGARTFSPAHEVIHEGREFSSQHPLPHVTIGHNCVMLGDQSCVPISAPNGHILVPVELSAATPDGKLYNPGGGYTWTDSAVLHARWQGNRLVWRMSEILKGDPARTTRGLVEPTIAFLDDGRLLMVMRGSNDKKPELPSRRWVSYSRDGGRTFSEAVPWTYSTGEPFFSPSSCSQLLKHKSGKLFWLGNLTPTNPKGNRPRYPFVIGEVDRRSGLLLKASARTIDDRQPGESEILTLSNFYAREDRETGGIALHMTRLFAHADGWEGDAMLYRIPVE